MKISNLIITRKALYSKARNYCLGKGVKLYTNSVCEAMILFLVDEYEKHEKIGIACLKGDIGSLYARKAEIDQKRLNDMTTYRQYLEQNYLKTNLK